MKKIAPWVEMLKIRASYGEVGNDIIGGRRFPYIGLVNSHPDGDYSLVNLEQTKYKVTEMVLLALLI